MFQREGTTGWLGWVMDPLSSSSLESTRGYELLLVSGELNRRPQRAADHAVENRAVLQLTQCLAHSPQRVLQTLTRLMPEICHAVSAAMTIPGEDHGQEVIRWRAVAGPFPSNIPRSMPRSASPCSSVAERRMAVVVRELHNHYEEFAVAEPRIQEALLIPLLTGNGLLGTLWLLCYHPGFGFDSEDIRLACALAQFASAMCEVLSSRDSLIHERDTLARENEQQRVAGRQKDKILTIIGHELRSPLAGMQYSLSYVTGRHTNQPDVLNALNILQRQLRQTSRLVDDLFDVAKTTRGKIQLMLERIDVSAPVLTAIETSRRLLESMHHELAVKLPAEPVWVDADPARLAQIVSNLLNNAAKYTPEGGHIEVSAERDGNEALIRVADDGIGIPRDMMDRIFEMFAQVMRPGSSAREGLGIGLGVVKELVRMHGGSVEVHSEGVGRGSEFLVRLPSRG